MTEPTPTEQEAILLRWRMLHPDAPADSHPGSEEAEFLLIQIRDRAATIEQEAFELLKKQMKLRPSGRSNRPQSQTTIIVMGVIAAAIVLLVAGKMLHLFP